MKKEILYISLGIPYDGVTHAGGKTLNYYIKKMADESWCNISLVAFGSAMEVSKSDGDKYGIKEYYIEQKNDIYSLIGNILSVNSKINPLHKFCNIFTWYAHYLLSRKLKRLSHLIQPDVIIVEWTQIGLDIDTIKRYFPNAIYYIDEVDVSFLGAYRLYKTEKNPIKKAYLKIRYQNFKKRELIALNKFNKVIVQNDKDKQLLLKNMMSEQRIMTIVPYYDSYIKVNHHRTINDIVFFGAMGRKENYLSVIWFIENVMPLIKDIDVRFVIVGSHPHNDLLKYESDRVVVTGFVESVEKYFQNAMCMVAPLVLGAGIKVKVIEGLSSGVPVLTNNIGIEGIPASNGVEYYLCEEPEEYSMIIRDIYNGDINTEVMSHKAKDFVNKMFDLNGSYLSYREIIKNC